jgi:hypothetical protein
MGPSITKGAITLSWRRPATKVIVFQRPSGTRPINRSPRGQRPRSLTMMVVVAVSQRKTSAVEPRRRCRRIQRRRARATSGRICSLACSIFLTADRVSLEEAPDRGTVASDPPLVHRCNHFLQRQIRLLGNESQQPGRVLLQRRCAPSGRLCRDATGLAPALQPFDRRTRGDLKAFGRLPPRRARFDHAQVIRIRPRNRSSPKTPTDAPRLAHSKNLENKQSALANFGFQYRSRRRARIRKLRAAPHPRHKSMPGRANGTIFPGEPSRFGFVGKPSKSLIRLVGC